MGRNRVLPHPVADLWRNDTQMDSSQNIHKMKGILPVGSVYFCTVLRCYHYILVKNKKNNECIVEENLREFALP